MGAFLPTKWGAKVIVGVSSQIGPSSLSFETIVPFTTAPGCAAARVWAMVDLNWWPNLRKTGTVKG